GLRGRGVISRGRGGRGAAGHLVGPGRRAPGSRRGPAGRAGAVQPAVRGAESAGRAEAWAGAGECRGRPLRFTGAWSPPSPVRTITGRPSFGSWRNAKPHSRRCTVT